MQGMWLLAHDLWSGVAPVLRRWIPAPVRRGVSALVGKRLIHGTPDRRYLCDVIFPAIRAAAPRRVLFVGCQDYTRRYHRHLSGIEYWTLDIDPDSARHGAPLHLIGDVKQADTLFDGRRFDAVILNGVFGWGVDEDADLDRTLVALHRTMTPGGVLVVGWNEGRCTDPSRRPVAAALFDHCPALGLPARRRFPDCDHVFDLMAAREGSG